MFTRLPLYLGLSLALISLVSMRAEAKYYLEVDAMAELSSLARNHKTVANFSITSTSGYRVKMENEFFISNWLTFHVGGETAQYTYDIADTRTLVNPSLAQTNYIGGFRMRFGNVMFDLGYMQKQLFILEDRQTTVHEIKQVPTGVVTAGFQIGATSRYWDLMMRLNGGTGSGTDENNEKLTLNFTLAATAVILFGRKNKTVFETISTQNLKQNEFLFGLIGQVREEAYKHNDFDYAISDVSLGLILQMQLN
ncbi:MAG: hypothetical protein H6624_01870 [Bdellovibrionaceae bacterium]|nr:hypothetical protein [Bdellovibrionales bacterium]MCB9083056.1 hypothetical protein [Pseudobdellovibrionaceae bacterium]